MDTNEKSEFRATVVATPRRGRRLGRGSNLRSVADLEEAFAKCEEDHSMRAVTSILRILREQLEVRSKSQGNLAVGGVYLFAGLAPTLGYFALPARLHLHNLVFACFFDAIGLTYFYGAYSVRTVVREYKDEESEIKKLATSSLERIWRQPFPRKPLNNEHTEALKKLLKVSPANETLLELHRLG